MTIFCPEGHDDISVHFGLSQVLHEGDLIVEGKIRELAPQKPDQTLSSSATEVWKMFSAFSGMRSDAGYFTKQQTSECAWCHAEYGQH